MVRGPTAGPSRAASSRGGSVARDILKKREKPYKTEHQKVLAKKRKLNLEITHHSRAPEGYTFLPVGTPDLADLCKKLSKQRDLPVSVVNAKTRSDFAKDPAKLSYHVHRIGYHFQSEVLEQAVADLQYTLHKGRFIKEADLAKKAQESLLSNTLLKHGVVMRDTGAQESPDQVRGAIRELFPRIPEDDLQQIVQHAWEEGSDRVGNAAALDLPRRVQLAVIARIRHKYTDYDRLLRAFEWAEARRMTEPVSLEKLIEWRGEHDVEDDDELEEIVRETIVIDDDDDETLANGSEADDEDSAAEQADNSDASIEVIHHLADDTDIGAESTVEGRHPPSRRYQQAPRRSQRQQNAAKQKLATARLNMKNGIASWAQQRADAAKPRTNPGDARTTHIPRDQNGRTPSSFVQNGVVYHPIPEEQGSRPRPPQQVLAPPQSAGLWASQHAPQSAPRPLQHHAWHQPGFATAQPRDRPVQSIEGGFSHPSTPGYAQQATHGTVRSHEGTPDTEYPSKRRRFDEVAQPQFANHGTPLRPTHREVIDLISPEKTRRREPAPFHGEVVDLMTPEPAYQPVHPSPLRQVNVSQQQHQGLDYARYYVEPQSDAMAWQHGPATGNGTSQQTRTANGYQDGADSLAYDPRQPMLQLPREVDRLRIQSHPDQRDYHMPGAWPQTPPQPQQQPQTQWHSPRIYYEAPQQPVYTQQTQPSRVYAYDPAPPPQIIYEQYPSRPTPAPVHGAPAPVQVVPRHAYQAAYGRSPTVPPPLPPTNGAPAPAQYIPR